MSNDPITSVYVPLRSNAAWFENEEYHSTLERRLKMVAMLYDRVILEDGRFHISAGKDGQGMQQLFPGGSFGHDRTKISYFTPGSPFSVAVDGQVFMSSEIEVAYEADFVPIVADAGIEHATWLRWNDGDVNQELKSAISNQANDDWLQKRFSTLPTNQFLYKHIVSGFYRDSLIAYALGSPLIVDAHASQFIEAQNQLATAKWSQTVEEKLFHHWINLKLPDFSIMPWSDLCELRESEAAKDFRRMIHDIGARAKQEFSGGDQTQEEIDRWVADEFTKELIVELSQRVKSESQLLASFGLNLIPFGSVASAIMDANAMFKDSNSWVSLIR